jgi:large subunit ribosomal protein L9
VKVILKEDITTLGKAGELVEVARGYGRNYLIPQGKALEATAQHLRQLEEQKRIILKRKAKDLEAAQRLADRITSLSIEISRKVVEEEKLYGSVSSKDIAEKLALQDIPLDRKRILLQEPIRTLGDFEVPVKLHPEVTSLLKVKVVAEKS